MLLVVAVAGDGGSDGTESTSTYLYMLKKCMPPLAWGLHLHNLLNYDPMTRDHSLMDFQKNEERVGWQGPGHRPGD